ncbi:MAG TPA: DUF1015 domain-containing protein [Candidatus Latescibacteria bacterium]|nr:DUF1015 domain-containing protein [Candidatus Latescibacterota bacterium]
MAQVIPFRGLLYNEKRVGRLDSVIAPPWDVISTELQDELYRRSRWNVVRLIFGKRFPNDDSKNNRYTRAKSFLQDWIKEGILIKDERPAIYASVEEFSVQDERKIRQGFIALAKLEEFGSGTFWPHEGTMEGAWTDRMRLIEECAANFSPIFSLYPDPDGTVEGIISQQMDRSPDIEVANNDETYRRVWKLTDPDIIGRICEEIDGRSVFIADGHHRYETALAFRNKMRSKYPGGGPHDYVLMYFANIYNPGLTILPVHRMIGNIPNFNAKRFLNRAEEFFQIERFKSTPSDLLQQMSLRKDEGNLLGLYAEGALYLLILTDRHLIDDLIDDDKPEEWKRLDVVVLHALLINYILGMDPASSDIRYTVDSEEVMRLVNREAYQIGIFLNPLKAEEIYAVAKRGIRMPPKSTYFYPKVPSGLVMNKIF